MKRIQPVVLFLFLVAGSAAPARAGAAAGPEESSPITTEPGAPVLPSPGETGPGISQPGASSVSPPPQEPGPPPAASPAAAEYEQKHVGFYKVMVPDLIHGGKTARWGSPYQGKEQQALSPDAFFDAVDHPEYADFYRYRRKVKLGLIIPGLSLMGAGLIVAIAGALVGIANPSCAPGESPSGGCASADISPNFAIMGPGIGIFGAGLAAFIAGSVLNRSPVPAEEYPELAAEHNRRLRQTLGLPDAPDDDVPQKPPAPVSLRITSGISPNSATFLLALRY
jgi:hypothetical protein